MAIPSNHIRIFIISMAVYIVINLVENMIHYNIGRNFEIEDVRDTKIITPSSVDITRIISVMAVFAVLQGLFTAILTRRFCV
jgi:hypothetical protein